MGLVARGKQPCDWKVGNSSPTPTPNLQGGERGRRGGINLNNHASVTKPPEKPERLAVGVGRAPRVDGHVELQGEWVLGELGPAPFPHALPWDVPELYPMQ